MSRIALIAALVIALGAPALAKEVPITGAAKENLRRELIAAYRGQKKLNLAWSYKRMPPKQAEGMEPAEALIGLFVEGDRIALLVEPMSDRFDRQEIVTDGETIVAVVTENEVDGIEVYRNDGVLRIRKEDAALKKVARSLFDGEQVMPPTRPFGVHIDIGVRYESDFDGVYVGAFDVVPIRDPVPFHLNKARFEAATVFRTKRDGPVITKSKRETYTIDPRTGFLREGIVKDETGHIRIHLTRADPIAESADYAELIAEKVKLDPGNVKQPMFDSAARRIQGLFLYASGLVEGVTSDKTAATRIDAFARAAFPVSYGSPSALYGVDLFIRKAKYKTRPEDDGLSKDVLTEALSKWRWRYWQKQIDIKKRHETYTKAMARLKKIVTNFTKQQIAKRWASQPR